MPKRKLTRSNRTQELDDYFEEFIESKLAEGLSDATISSYRYSYRKFVEFVGNQQATPELARKWVVWLLSDCKLSNRTVSDYVKRMKTFFNYIDSDVFSSVKNVKHTPPDITVLNPEELRSLLRVPNQKYYADFRNYVLMTLLIDSMVRINEAVNIREQDIDVTARTITIRASTTKTRRTRIVPVGSRTIRLTKELIRENEDFLTDFVFVSNNGDRLEPNHFRKVLKRYAKLVGITKKVSPHVFRHTAATMFLENGGDIRHLQMILGHTDMRMVQRYTHLSGKSIHKQHEKYSASKSVLESKNKPRKVLRNIEK